MSQSKEAVTRLVAVGLFAVGFFGWLTQYLWGDAAGRALVDQVWSMSFLAILGAGLVLAMRIPGNLFGWLLLCSPAFINLGNALRSETSELGEYIFGAGILVALTALYLFPDGRLPPRLWVILWFVAFVVMNVLARLVPDEVAFGTETVGIFLWIIGGAGSLIQRFTRGTPDVRRQLALPLLVLVVAFLGAVGLVTTETANVWADVSVALVVTIGFPVALVVAVSRYRLYDVDRFISRTITYALVVTILGLTYAGLVALVSLQFDDALAVAGATLTVAALFNPVRRRLHSWVDRRFNRAKYDSERVMNDFSATLKDRIDSDDLVSGWVGVVLETMEPSSVAVWVRGS